MIDIDKIRGLDLINPNLWEFYFHENIDIKYKVQDFSLPFPSFELETQHYRKYYTKRNPYDDISITFLEDSTYTTLRTLEFKYNYIYNFNENFFIRLDEYTESREKEQTGYLILQKFNLLKFPDQIENTIGWKFTGLKLKSIDSRSFNYNDTSPFTWSATFAVEDIERLSVSEVNQLFVQPPPQE